MTKAAIIFGSPRKNGNTHILLDEARRGLAESGVDSTVFYLNDLKIRGCQACYHCKRTGELGCAIKDDMQAIHEAIQSSEGLIVATPIYFAGVTGQTKIWLDRMFPYIDRQLGAKMPRGKRAAFIYTQNQPDPARFTGTIKVFQSVFGLFGYEVRGSLLACNLDKGYKPMVTEDREAMEKAYALRKNLF